MLAVIKTGGKQYLVAPGQKIKIEKIKANEGQEIIFDEVLLLEKEKKLKIGSPLVEEAKVVAKVLKQSRGKKKIIFKYKPKTRYKVKKGHHQNFTEIEITKLI